ncbi:MAG: sodium/glutamate symporter [Planctomycetota bacterium]
MISFVVLCVLLGVGHVLRSQIKLLGRLYLPSCVVGGILGLVVIQLLAAMDGGSGKIHDLNLALGRWSGPWEDLPGFLINVVFACLFLGVKLPNFSQLCRRAGPQLAYGQIVAWGQYVVGLGLWVFAFGWIFKDFPAMFAGILPVGFEGGHGTAAGLAETFVRHGWPEGKDFALASATFGITSAIIVGMILVNWAIRKGYCQALETQTKKGTDDLTGIIEPGQRPMAGRLTVSSDVIETFSLHIVVVAAAVGLGYLARQGLITVENRVEYLAENKFLSSFPLFPLCMLGGLVIQIIEQHFDKNHLIDSGLIRRIQNSSLDFLVIAAIATIKLDLILAGLVPLLLLVAAGIAWNVFCVMWLARRVLPDNWFARAIAEMGQSMGVTATGLLLLRVVDPDYETPAADAFACKQLVHEPFMGGGLWTGAAIGLIAIYGAPVVLLISVVALAFWFGVVFRGRIFRTIG